MDRKEYMRTYLKKYRVAYKRRFKELKSLWQKRNPEYRIFCSLKQRCNNPHNSKFEYYGGRGIKCLLKTWRDIPTAIGKRPSALYTLDRINNDGHYQLNNIRWATRTQQIHNRRRCAR